MTISTAVVAATLKPVLGAVIDDSMDGLTPKVMKATFDERTMKDAYEDDQEYGGPGLAAEKSEGASMQLGGIRAGASTRYWARTFALRMNITKEALEDTKYESQAVMLAKRLKRAMVKTMEYDAALVFARATSSSYVGGDGVALASASHTIPYGGTFSNLAATAVSPSEPALIIARAAIRAYPGHDGLRDGTMMAKKVVCPIEQEGEWEKILKSKMAPAAGEFNAINVANRMDLELVVNPYWTSTTTNWCLITDCDNGLSFRVRRKPEANTWPEPGETIVAHSITARWARGWSDPRCVYFVNA